MKEDPQTYNKPDDAPQNLIEVRYRREDNVLDEIVSENCTFHLEQMSENTYWMAVYKDGHRQIVNFEVALDKNGKPKIWTEGEAI